VGFTAPALDIVPRKRSTAGEKGGKNAMEQGKSGGRSETVAAGISAKLRLPWERGGADRRALGPKARIRTAGGGGHIGKKGENLSGG